MSDIIFRGTDEAAAKPWLDVSPLTLKDIMLPAGDYCWGSPVYGRVGVEAKEVTDLLSSVDTANANMIPRLDDELRRLQESYSLPILLTHGWGKWEFLNRDTSGGRWTLESIDNLILGRQLRGIVHVRARGTKGAHGLGQRLVSLHQYTQKPLLDRLIVPRYFPYTGPLSERSEALYGLLARLRGLKHRKELAETWAARFSISEVVAKEVDDLIDMGLSKVMARRFVALTHGKEA